MKDHKCGGENCIVCGYREKLKQLKSRPDDTIGEKLARKLAGRTSSKSSALKNKKFK